MEWLCNEDLIGPFPYYRLSEAIGFAVGSGGIGFHPALKEILKSGNSSLPDPDQMNNLLKGHICLTEMPSQ